MAPLPVAPEPIPEPPTSGAEDTAALDRSAITPEPDTIRDPLGEAAAAIESSDAPRSRRGRSRSESRARRRAGKVGGERPTAADGLVARLPGIKPLYAAFITGALAGLAAVALATGASRGCEAVRDTSSCGGGLGLLALLGILAIEVVIAATLLKAWQISDPLSTSFLGVALVAIIAMLTFLDELDSVWMLLVIPVLTAAAFVLSWWVTVRFVDEYPNASAHHPKGETDESLVE